MSQPYEGLSSAIQLDVIDCRHLALYRNHSSGSSNAAGPEGSSTSEVAVTAEC